MQEQNIPDQPDQQNKPKPPVVITYEAPQTIFALNFSHNMNYPFRLGIGSFLKDIKNYVHILQLNEQWKFVEKISFQHRFPPTKILFNPQHIGEGPDLMATSGQNLKIYQIRDNQSVQLSEELVCMSQFCAPLTSMDWNPLQNNFIGTCSIDTSCTIWDIVKGQIYTQILAHEKEVFDIHFSNEREIFATVGADGCVRQLDMRDLTNSQVLYRTINKAPIVKLAYNRNQPSSNLLAFLQMEMQYVTLIDKKKPLSFYHRFLGHKDNVNAFGWAPESASHICSVSDDGRACLYDFIRGHPPSYEAPLAEYKIGEKITNMAWSPLQKQCIGICFNNTLQLLTI